MEQKNFDEVATAYKQVKEIGAALKADYLKTCSDIELAQGELEALPLAPVPFEDMKAAILDFVDASGERHAVRTRAFITDFANGKTACNGGAGGMGVDYKDVGKPLSFGVLQSAIFSDNSATAANNARILTGGVAAYFDQALYCFCGQLIRDGLQKTMDGMTPAEFGYDKINPKEVGSPRHERVATIAALEERLVELLSRKRDLEGKILTLGFEIPPTAKRKP